VAASVDDVAAAILTRTGEVTTWKLQKLAYYAQSWYLVRHGKRLFEDDFEAWKHGPVVPALYRQHKGRNRVRDWPAGDAGRLEPTDQAFVDEIVGRYGRFTAEALSRMSHMEAPWLVTRAGLTDDAKSSLVISSDLMRNFYSRQVANASDAVTTAVANSYIEGVELDEDWQDQLLSVADGTLSANDLVEQEVRRAARG
jgi:uncharacterized phage-associated protein